MTDEEIIDAYWKSHDPDGSLDEMRFARAIEEQARREERETCARVCDEFRGPIEIFNRHYPRLLDCAAAIRARTTDSAAATQTPD